VPNGRRTEDGAGAFPLILTFVKDRAALTKELPSCKKKLAAGGALWIAYLKGTSGKATDINRDSIRDYVGTIELDTVAQIALDDEWSALRPAILNDHSPPCSRRGSACDAGWWF
jgi:hypothetical protein